MKIVRKAVLRAAVASSLLTVFVPATPAMARDRIKNVCQDLQKPFRKIKNYQRDQAIKGAAIGAALGVLTGVVRNEVRPKGQKKSSILPWVIGGAVSGGVVGYVSSKAEAQKNSEELRQAIQDDYGETLGNYSTMPEKIVALGECRRGQIYETELMLTDGSITVKEAKKRLEKIDKWIAKDDEIVAKAAKVQFDGVAEYARAHRLAEGYTPEETEDRDANLGRYYDAQREADVEVIVVSNPGLTDEAAEPVFDTYYVSARSGLNLRDAPNTSGEKVTLIPFRQKVGAYNSDTPAWKAVRYGDYEGFAHSDYITFDRPAARPPQPKTGYHRVNYKKKNRSVNSANESAAAAIANQRATQTTLNSNGQATSAQRAQLQAIIELQSKPA